MTLDNVKKLNIPTNPGCYQYYNKAGDLIYIGKAVNLRSRVLSYWREGTAHTPAKAKMVKDIAKIMWIEVDSEIEALLLEANLIKKHQPFYNVDLRDDKRFFYVNISLEDEIPGVFLSRKINKSGRYFGPFVSSQALKETLKAVRKIWPYCTMRKIQKKPCFYYQIGRCLGPCGNKVTIKEYNEKVIKPLILFFENKKTKVVKDLEKEKKQLEKLGKLEEAGVIAYRLEQMKRVLENTRVLGVSEKYANDVIELAKILDLPKIPKRIEGYDISNTFGKSAVGSMVVFDNGEADKNEYRKFKITGKYSVDRKKGDVQMLSEIMERRLNNDWPLPDLIIIDGGKQQLNAAGKILKKAKVNITYIGITKGEGLRSSGAPDKIFFPGEAKPLQLPLASPALHLIKRVRDESHRFAITYHRKLRSKKFLA
ncbi:MAG: excinuclease ABC subunit UvrC [Candidatus Falkowbacteria bacterium]|nr:excinuclease ABC subunit UvrC [Candidatus Falkowbacteria bacterium]